MVPGTATASFIAPSTEEALAIEKFFDYVEANPVTGRLKQKMNK